MSRRFETVLVTGASSGMGRAFAHRLLKEGMVVYAAARSVDKMADLADAGAIVIGMDITKDADIARAVAQITKAHGGVDVLVNNAGYAQYGPVEETPLNRARRQFEVNLFGLARLTQLLLPAMRDRGRGRIINISSMGGKIYTPLGAWYHATKHALEGWSDCLRLELAPHGIDVVIVEPGIIRTGFSDALDDSFSGERDGPYGGMIKALLGGMREMQGSGRGSAPDVITDLIVQAIRAERPRTRYAKGYMGRPLMFMRWLLPDRWFDRVVLSQVK